MNDILTNLSGQSSVFPFVHYVKQINKSLHRAHTVTTTGRYLTLTMQLIATKLLSAEALSLSHREVSSVKARLHNFGWTASTSNNQIYLFNVPVFVPLLAVISRVSLGVALYPSSLLQSAHLFLISLHLKPGFSLAAGLLFFFFLFFFFLLTFCLFVCCFIILSIQISFCTPGPLVIQSACLLVIISAMTLIARQPLIHLLVFVLICLYNTSCSN